MPKKEYNFSTDVGKHLVIMITCMRHTYIAEVTQKEPLRMKVEESGPYAHLKDGDYIIIRSDSEQIQDDDRSTALLKEYVDRGHPLVSGLKSLGVKDNKLRMILPIPEKTRKKKTKKAVN